MNHLKFHLLKLGVLISLFAPLAGCFSGQSDMVRIQRVIANDPALDEFPKYSEVMSRWLHCAWNNDIDGMIALTSKITIEQEGIEKLRKLYTEDSAPALQRFRIYKKGGECKYVADGKGTTGWIFNPVWTSADGKVGKFQFTVLKEDGVIKVSSFGLQK